MLTINTIYKIQINTRLELPDPGDGFIDNKSSEQYRSFNYSTNQVTGYTTTWTNAMKKERANLRWDFMLEQLSENATPVDIQVDPTGTGADANTAPAFFVFQISFDRPDTIYTRDELNPGELLYGEPALKRQVARALTTNIHRRRLVQDPYTDYGDPTTWTGKSQILIDVHAGPAIASLTDAESYIQVSKVHPII